MSMFKNSQFEEKEFFSLILRFNFIAKINQGDKVCIKSHLIINKDLWYGPILRYFLDETRNQTLVELRDLSKISRRYINILRSVKSSNSTKYLNELSQSIKNSIVGIQNLSNTYKDDISTTMQLNDIINDYTTIIKIISEYLQHQYLESSIKCIKCTDETPPMGIPSSAPARMQIPSFPSLLRMLDDTTKKSPEFPRFTNPSDNDDNFLDDPIRESSNENPSPTQSMGDSYPGKNYIDLNT